MFIFVLINLSFAVEVISPIETTSNGEIVMFTKMNQDECVIERGGSKKLIFIKSLPFVLHFKTQDCSGARIAVDELEPSSVKSFSQKSIAALEPCRGHDEPPFGDSIFITSACSVTSSGSSQYRIIDNSLITLNYNTSDCSGLSLQSHCVHCGESFSSYKLVCSSAFSILSMVSILLVFIFTV